MQLLGGIYDDLGATSPAAEVILIHGNASSMQFPLQEAFPEARISIVYREGSNAGYDELTGLAKQYPTLDALCSSLGVGSAPLVVMAYSAGGWALRYYLRAAAARARVRAAAFLDSLYGAPNGACDLAPYGGVVEYAKLAHANPTERRLYLTYSSEHPAPGICSKAVQQIAGGGPGIVVQGFPGTHAEQQTIVAPKVEADIRTWLLSQPAMPPGPTAPSSSSKSSYGWLPWAAAAIVAGVAVSR